MSTFFRLSKKIAGFATAFLVMFSVIAVPMADAALTPNYPKISNLTVDKPTFDPVTQDLNINFNLGETATIVVDIYSSGSVVRSMNVGQKPSGPNTVSWDGTVSSGGNAASGKYDINVRSTSSIGEKDSGWTSVNVSTSGGTQPPPGGQPPSGQQTPPTGVAPLISNLKAIPPSINVGGQTAIEFNLDASATSLSVAVYQSGTFVRSLHSGTGVKGYNGPFTWSGNTTSGSTVSPGTYTVTVTASNTNGSDTKSVNVVVTQQAPPPPTGVAPFISGLTVDPTSFTPGQQNVSVTFILDASATNLSVVVSGIKTIHSGPGSKGFNGPYVWDGRDASGNLVSPGTYTIRVNASNENGTAPEASAFVTAMQGPITCPAGYTPSGSTCVPVTVQCPSGYVPSGSTCVPQTTTPPQCPNGQYAYWNGSVWLCPGGNTGTGYPEILQDFASPNPFNPQVHGQVTIHYLVASTAYTTVEILKDGSLIRTIKPSTNESGANIAVWDGRYSYGGYVSAGNYTYRIRTNNNSGTDTEEGIISVVSTQFPQPVFCAGFIDVPISSPYCKAIQELFKLKIFQGYPDGTFRPFEKINRAETVKVMLIALDYPKLSYLGHPGFPDVTFNAWYVPYIATAKAYGIIHGYPDGYFRPGNTINRVELLKVMLRAANSQPTVCYSKPYSDTPIKSDTLWYMPYACYAKQYLLVDPDIQGRLRPAEKMTRGDVATLIYRAYIQGLLNYTPPSLPPAGAYVDPVYSPPMYNPQIPGTMSCPGAYWNTAGQYVCPFNPPVLNIPAVSTHNVSPKTFNPYSNILTAITYSLTMPGKVTLQIVNSSNGNVMRTLKTSIPEGQGSQVMYWDGKDTVGNYVYPGLYKYRITVSDTNSVYSNSKEGFITVTY